MSPEATQRRISVNFSLRNWALELFRICFVTSIPDPREIKLLGYPHRHRSLERMQFAAEW